MVKIVTRYYIFLFLFVTMILPACNHHNDDEAVNATGEMSNARSQFTMTLLDDGKVLVTGGNQSTGALNGAEIYDPSTGSFSATGNMLHPRFVHTATLLPNDTVLITGGFNNAEGFMQSTEIYDPETGQFTAGPDLTEPRDNQMATLLKTGKVLITGGDSNAPNYISSAELYDPEANNFTVTGSMHFPRTHHTQTLLKDGRVLITGGNSINDDGSLAFLISAEIYDPQTGIFTPTGNMNIGRKQHRAILLYDGRVLITGGYGDNLITVASAEIYDPATEKFSMLNSMNHERAVHSMALLDNDKVLITGGVSRHPGVFSGILTSIELFDPDTEQFQEVGDLLEPTTFHGSVTLKNGDILIVGGVIAGAVWSARTTVFSPSNCATCR